MNSAEYFEEEYQRQMYRRIGCLPILLLCVVLSFVGCKTIHDSELIEIHDTVTTHRVDTVRVYQIKTVHDTIRETSPSQFWSTLNHELYHATTAIIDFYGEPYDQEPAAYLQGELMRLAVEAIGEPCM